MKIQIIATEPPLIKSNSRKYKSKEDSLQPLIDKILMQVDVVLHENSSLLELIDEKRKEINTNYLVIVTEETRQLISGLILYNLIDEILFFHPASQQLSSYKSLNTLLSDKWYLDHSIKYRKGYYCHVFRHTD